MTAPVIEPTTTGTDTPEVLHLTCRCQRGATLQFSLCGWDVTGVLEWLGEPIQPCTVCADLASKPCERCGR